MLAHSRLSALPIITSSRLQVNWRTRQTNQLETSNTSNMGKAKATKPALSGPQKAMHSRVSYLYQAAIHLAINQPDHEDKQQENTAGIPRKAEDNPKTYTGNMSRRYVSEMRSITQKAQLRMSPDMKHSICKNCDSLLLEGSTCISVVENKSKGGRKSWADILLRKCTACGKETRIPLALKRQKRKHHRLSEDPLESKPEANGTPG